MFSYVPQGNFLYFRVQSRDTLHLCRTGNPDDERIIVSAKIACAYDFINRLPNGLDTVVGENGKGLSEVRYKELRLRERFTVILRLLFLMRQPRHLTPKQVQLLKNLKTLKDKTCILISHKMAAKEICNKEIVIRIKKLFLTIFRWVQAKSSD